MKMKKFFGSLGLAAALCAAGQAVAAPGDCQANAEPITVNNTTPRTASIRLVNEYNEWFGGYTDWGAYYCKAELKKGHSYTFWVTDEKNASLYNVGPDFWDEKAPMTQFSFSYDAAKGIIYYILNGTDWYPDDPASGVYYISFSGEIGGTATLHYMEGVPYDPGTRENPVQVYPSTTELSVQNNLIDGEFYYIATLTAGNKYFFSTKEVSSSAPVDFIVNSDTTIAGPTVLKRIEDGNNVKYEVVPSETGTYWAILMSEKATAAKIAYSVLLQRPITDPSRNPFELKESNAWTSDAFTPGRINKTGSAYYDNIIDEHLFSMQLTKGRRYAFDATGSKTNLIMRLYDKTGKVLAENLGSGTGYDCRIVLTAEASEKYYIGVCQNLANPEDDPVMEGNDEVVLKAMSADPVQGEPDEFDPNDDEATETAVTALDPVVGKFDTDPRIVDTAARKAHRLSATDWYDTFVIAARKGISYRIKAKSDVATGVGLVAQVFTLNGTKEVSVSSTGSIDPRDGTSILEFTATANNRYYIRVSTAGSVGFDYPPYTVHASAYSSTAELYSLKVTIKGSTTSYWQLKADGSSGAKYQSGDSVLVTGDQVVTAPNLSGFKTVITPAKATAATPNVSVAYSDMKDPADDKMTGAVTVNPSAKTVLESRTLYADDPADWFKFTAKAGTYYNFALSNVTDDAKLTIYAADGTTAIAFGSKDIPVERLALDAGTYYAVVAHTEASTPGDGSYSLAHNSANVGEIKLAKTALTVKENAAYADITVNRTGKDGAVRVLFGTIAGTALPGKNYYPTNGVLAWAANDNKAKTIRVRLIPNLIATWEENKTFKVQIKPIDEIDLQPGEYLAKISVDAKTKAVQDTATVTLTEVSKKAPGTVSAVSYQEDDWGFVKVADPKKAVINVTAGKTLTIHVARTAGADGRIAVKVAARNGKAYAGKEFTLTSSDALEWSDGELTPQDIVIDTTEFADFVESKNFTLSLTKIAKDPSGVAYDSPTIASASITVNILNQKMQKSMATFTKEAGTKAEVQVKEAKAGTWYVDRNGSFVSTPITSQQKTAGLTFTVTGPGKLEFTPQVEGNATFEYKVGNARTMTPFTLNEKNTIYVPTGKQTVTLTATRTDGEPAATLKYDVCVCNPDELPYAWTVLPAAVAAAPTLDKAVVLPGETTLAFERKSGVSYKVFLMNSAERGKSAATNKPMKLGDPETEVPWQGGVYRTNLVANVKYTWRVDSYWADAEGKMLLANTNKTAWTLSTVTADAATAGLTTAFSGTDAYGNAVRGNTPGEIVWLAQGVKAKFSLGDEAQDSATTKRSYALLAGKLPDGVKLVKTAVKEGTRVVGNVTTLEGVPTKAGDYQAILQVTDDRLKGATVAVTFRVVAIDYAIGTFNGVLAADSYQSGFMSLGSIALTTTAQGKLTGKVSAGGKTYSFAGTGFDYVEETAYDGDGNQIPTLLSAEVQLKTKIADVFHVMRLTLKNGDSKDLALLGSVAGDIKVEIIDETGTGADMFYAGRLFRDNSKNADYLAAFNEAFGGYYTISLPIINPQDGCPKGNGYLTVKFDAKGAGTVAGQLADDTKISCKAVAAMVGDLADPASCELFLPVFQAKSPYAFGGELRIANAELEGELVPVADSTLPLYWRSDNAKATYGGEWGWDYELQPCGGFYNTVYNLQAYYLSKDFAVDAGSWTDLPEELLTGAYAGFKYVAEVYPQTYPTGQKIDIVGDALSAEKRVLAKRTDNKTLNDWEKSVNPANVTYKFTRATGLVSGTFGIWMTKDEMKSGVVKTTEKELTNIKHYGVMMLSRDPFALFGEDTLTAGYFLVPTTLADKRKYTASLPFNVILSEDRGEEDWCKDDWSEDCLLDDEPECEHCEL